MKDKIKIFDIISQKYLVLISSLAIGWVLILSINSLKKSYYINNVNSALPVFITTILLIAAAGAALIKLSGNQNHVVFLVTITAIIQMGTTAAMPLLYYTSKYPGEYVLSISKKCLYTICLFYATVFLSTAVLPKMKKMFRTKAFTFILFVGTFVMSWLILAFSRNNTTLLFGVQAGFIMIGLFILHWCVLLEAEEKFRLIPLSSILIGSLCMVIKGETGLPSIFVMAVLIWWIFFHHKKTRRQVIVILSLTAAAVIACGTLYMYSEAGWDFAPGFVGVLADKVAGRLNYSENHQIKECLNSLEVSKWLGNSKQYVYIFAGSSDFAVTVILRYLGLLFLPILLITVICAAFSFAEKSHSKATGRNQMGELCFCIILIMILYNTTMNSAAAPIIGVSCYGAGMGLMHNLFCGFLLGSALSDSCEFKLKDMMITDRKKADEK